jgi:hypothetical protein
MSIGTSPDHRNSHLESALVHATFVRQNPAKTHKKPQPAVFLPKKLPTEIPAESRL